MELEFVRGVRIKEDTAIAVTKIAKENGIILSVHAPYYINFNSREKEKIVASRHRLLQSARIGNLCGAKNVVFHPGFYMGKEKNDVYKVIKQDLQQIVEILKKEDNEITLRPEVTGKMSSFGDLEEVVKLSSDIDNIIPCVVFAHLHARTGEYNTYEEFYNALKFIADHLGKKVLQNMHIRVAGILYGPKGERKHFNLEESDLNYKDLLRALKDFGVQGTVICESPNLEEDALLMQRKYKTLLKQKKDKDVV